MDDILGVAGRRVPLNPLRICPCGLTFEAVGASVREGILFKGIAHESERPGILEQVPNEGLDVQHEPVHSA